jgi:FtsP/CotA-like multicopper oxidase with cupredoxin domain
MNLTRRTFIRLGAVFGGTLVTRAAPGESVQSDGYPSRLTSVDGRLDIELVAREQGMDLAGRSARLWAFNGQVPGPLLEAAAGDEVQVRLRNLLPDATNLHFHGLHVPPSGAADNIFLEIPPGETLSYAFRIPRDHAAGLFWLHPHLHGSVAEQVSRGLAAPLVIRGALDAISEVAAAREHVLVLQDFALDRQGQPVAPSMNAMMDGREGSLVTVSGRTTPRLLVERGGLLRLRFLNASASRFYRLALGEHPMHVIATDGGSLPAPQSVDELLLAPGERRDVLVAASRQAGEYRLRSLPYTRGTAGMMGGMIGTPTPLELATVVYDGNATNAPGIPSSLTSVDPLPATAIRRRFILSESMGMMPGRGMGARFLINGREFDHRRIDDTVRLGDVEDWEYTNNTDMDHPMHVHTNAFQRVGADGRAEPAWLDGIVVPARGRVRIRTGFSDFTGTSVQHCHILDHEDLGMMSTVRIEA